MDTPVRPIAILQGAENAVIQQLLRDFVVRWRSSARIVGVIEALSGEGPRACGPGTLESIADGQHHTLFQDLGEGSAACALDARGVVRASEAVLRDIAGGCDLVVLSKFGKLEAENRSGLMPAFVAAIEAGVPVLTSVSPRFDAGWQAFAAPYFVSLPADPHAADDWWQATRACSRAAA